MSFGIALPALDRARFVWRVIGGVALTHVLVGALVAFHLSHTRAEYEQQAERDAQNVSRTLEQSLGDTIERVEQSLHTISEEVTHQLASGGIKDEQLSAMMARQQGRLRDVFSLRVFDADGHNTHHAGATPLRPVNVADRDYFRYLRDQPEAGTYITPRLVTRSTDVPAMVLSRRLNHPDGRFAGVVNGTIDLSHIGWQFSLFDVGEGGVISLCDAQGNIVVRHPALAPREGVDPSRIPSAVRDFILAQRQYGVLSLTSPLDGRDRVVSVRRVGNAPLYVTAGVSLDAYPARWWHEAVVEGLMLAAFMLVTAGMAMQLNRDWRARDELIKELDEKQQKFRTLATMSADWFWEQDEHFRMVSVSKDLAEHGLNNSDILGKARWELPTDKTAEEWQAHRMVLEAHEPFYDFEYCILTATGEKRCLISSGEPVFDRNGKFAGYQGVSRDITERRQYEERIEKMAQYDHLTGLPNRALFNDRMDRAISMARREGRPCALLYFDLDKFKPVNDLYGHDKGDQLLQMVATRTTYLLRESDTVARVGGDEFVVMLPPTTDHTDAEEVAKKIISAVTSPYRLDGVEESVEIGVSIGIAVYPQDGTQRESLIRAADTAMYQAKRSGNSYAFCRPDTGSAVPARGPD